MYDSLITQVQDAKEALAVLHASQEPIRATIREMVASLNAKTQPLEDNLAKLEAALLDQKQRTIGPWRGSTHNGFLDVYGKEPEWHTRRAWLRVVLTDYDPSTGHKPLWQADIDLREGNKRIFLNLGPPSANRNLDFIAHKLTVEAKCRELGYIIAQEGE